jgi:hypothetical protein
VARGIFLTTENTDFFVWTFLREAPADLVLTRVQEMPFGRDHK